MAIRVFNSSLKKRFIGTSEIKRVYSGVSLLWQSTSQYLSTFLNTATFYGSTVESSSNVTSVIDDLRERDVFDGATFLLVPSATKFSRVGVQLPERPRNLLSYSELFTNSFWGKSNASATASAVISPDGLSTTNLFLENTANAQHAILTNSTTIPIKQGDVISASLYVKNYSSDRNVLLYILDSSYVIAFAVIVNPQTGAIQIQNNQVGGVVLSSSVSSVGDGWYRISLTGTLSTSTTARFGIYSTIGTNGNYLGNGTSGFYIWGAQLEINSSVTTYQKTLETDFDLTLTRASTATRVNAAGLIEASPRNLLQRSEEFDNAIWNKTRLTVTTNVAIAPNNTLTADKLVEDNTNNTRWLGNIAQAGNYSSGQTVTYSMYVKAVERSFFYFQINDGSVNFPHVWFNLSTTSVGTKSTPLTVTIIDVGNSWKRVSITYTIVTGGAQNLAMSPAATNGAASYQGDGVSGILLWGIQLEFGSTVTDYVATTDRLNHPRIDYSSGVPSLLLEPQRTNLVRYSDISDVAGWFSTPTDFLYTNETFLGLRGGKLVVLNTGNGSDYNRGLRSTIQTISVTTNSYYAVSFYVKKTGATNTFGYFIMDSSNGQQYSALFNVVTNTRTNNYIQNVVPQGFKIINLGNGIYRCIDYIQTTANNNYNFASFGFGMGVNANVLGMEGIFSGLQFEVGSYETSYIPTTTTSVTRIADICSKNIGVENIGQTEGTIFMDITVSTGIADDVFYFNQNITGNVVVTRTAINSVQVRIYYGGSFNIFALGSITATRLKIVVAYKSGNSALYVNGVGVQDSQTFSFTTPLTEITLRKEAYITASNSKSINSLSIYKTRLSNAQCIALSGFSLTERISSEGGVTE